MKKIFLILIVLALVIIILLGFLFWPKNNQPINQDNNMPEVKQGITISLPKVNDIISSPLKIVGTVIGYGWTGFEGQVGTVTLYDGGDNELAKGVLKATTEWTALPTNFEVTLEFNTGFSGGSLVFQNENPSGDPDKDKTFMLPVKFK